MNSPEVHFTDQRLDEVLRPELGRLTEKLGALGDDLARERFGENAFRTPTDILITPTPVETGDYYIIVGFHHQTGGVAPGVFQKHDTSLGLTLRGENAYLKCEEGGMSIPLTPREAIFMQKIARVSVEALIDDSRRSTE